MTTEGATTIYEEDLTYPAPGSAHYDQISRAQITALVLSGTASITAHYYIAYGYDSQNQLTGMVTYNGVYGSTGGGESHFTIASESFAYDSLGNRTDLNASGTANIDIMNQYLADAASHSLTYDARGNLTGTYDYAYTYDELNRMTSATPTNHASDKAVYTYDFQNNRTSETLYAWDSGMGGAGDWSTTAASVTQYLYNGQMLVAEINGLTGKMTKSYEWDPTKPNGVGGLLCITTYDTDGVTVTGKYKPVYDANANVVALTDLSTGAVVANYGYTAFGICTATGPMADVCNFRFGGMYWQAGANKYYDKARDYDAGLGRFMQRDPSGEDGGDNLGAYCAENPVNQIDPTGTIVYVDDPTAVAKPMDLFFGEENVYYKVLQGGKYEIVLKEPDAYNHLMKYKGNPEYKSYILSAIHDPDRTFNGLAEVSRGFYDEKEKRDAALEKASRPRDGEINANNPYMPLIFKNGHWITMGEYQNHRGDYDNPRPSIEDWATIPPGTHGPEFSLGGGVGGSVVVGGGFSGGVNYYFDSYGNWALVIETSARVGFEIGAGGNAKFIGGNLNDYLKGAGWDINFGIGPVSGGWDAGSNVVGGSGPGGVHGGGGVAPPKIDGGASIGYSLPPIIIACDLSHH